MQYILSSRHLVHPKYHEPIVRTYRYTSYSIVRLTFSHLVYIQKNLLLSIQRTFLTTDLIVLFSFFRTRVVIITVMEIRYRLVLFLDAALHLFEKLILQLFGAGHHRFGIGIFGLKISDNFCGIWSLFEVVVQPIIIIYHRISMDNTSIRFDLCYRRLHLRPFYSNLFLLVRTRHHSHR